MKILTTLGPASLNKKFLKFSNKNISLLRINLSHVSINELPKIIKFVRKYSKVPICLDTEGAQIRTKVLKKKFFRKNSKIAFKKKNKINLFYPSYVLEKVKLGDQFDVGFSGLKLKILKNSNKELKFKVLNSGWLENNKGVHLINRKIKLNYLTQKDFEAIKIAKKMGIKNYALSFTNNIKDVINFTNLLKNEKKIYKLETREAIKNLSKILQKGNYFLIDRGDLSKEISTEMIPVAQRQIIISAKKSKNKEVFVATNFLESMLENNFATRGEVNDIYSTLSQGAKGLVLAAETAIGKNPIECVNVIKKIYKIFKKNKNKFNI
tara:strand:- start:18905 stop:19873 length:969 start_codon:yes stop_codon:yes gene_type:complete